MQLNYKLNKKENFNNTIPIIMIHGLFGDLNNLRSLATALIRNNCVIQIDLRNHGNSPHQQSMTYIDMAQDVLDLLDQLLIQKCIVIGHSMGGKVAMMLCMLASQRVKKLIIIDIAPVQYDMKKYNFIFDAIEHVNKSKVTNKTIAAKLMQQHISDQLLIAFLLKSFYQGYWKFNFLFIKNNYFHIGDWCMRCTWWGPTLFIKGVRSTYLHIKYIYDIYHQFPNAYIHNVPNAGHWVHYDNPVYVINIINKFIFHKFL